MRPRSNGCRVCVSRRIRCDLTRPFCLRCKIAGRVCDGYSLKFVVESPTTIAGAASGRDKATGAQPSTTVEGLVPSFISRAYDQMSRDTGLLDFNRLSITTSPLRNYTEDVFCKFYLDQNYSFGTWDSEIQNNRQWMYEILQLPSKHPVSVIALRCVITGFFGQAQRNANLTAEAAKLYPQAIVALKHGLESEGAQASPPRRPFPSFQLLAATMLLLQYEYLAVTPPNGWIRHTNGLEALIKLRGPSYFRRRGTPQRALLRRAKMSLYIDDLRAYKPYFMDQDEWRSIWIDDEEGTEQSDVSSDQDDRSASSGNTSADLEDILAGFSRVVTGVDKLKKMQLEGRNMRNEMPRIRRCQDALMEIASDAKEWFESRSLDPANESITVTIEPSEAPPIQTFSGTFLSFSSLTAAHDFCKYHTYSILILLWLNRIRSLIPAGSNDDATNKTALSSTQPFPGIMSPSEFASKGHPDAIRALSHGRSIIEALPMYTLPQFRYTGGLFATFPARTAWQTFPVSSKEALWVQKFLNRAADASGFELLRHVCRNL